MEDNKIRVGITQGDINGVGYEVILKTFADPVMLELCPDEPSRYAYSAALLCLLSHLVEFAQLVGTPF